MLVLMGIAGIVVGFLAHDMVCFLYESMMAKWLGRNLHKEVDPLIVKVIKRLNAIQDAFNADDRTYMVVQLKHQAQGLIDDLERLSDER